jgi:hypothetical protein
MHAILVLKIVVDLVCYEDCLLHVAITLDNESVPVNQAALSCSPVLLGT